MQFYFVPFKNVEYYGITNVYPSTKHTNCVNRFRAKSRWKYFKEDNVNNSDLKMFVTARSVFPGDFTQNVVRS